MKALFSGIFLFLIFVQGLLGQKLKSIDLPLIHGDEFVKAGHPIRNIQYVEEGGERFLYISCMFNIRTINIYNFHNEGLKFYKKIEIESEGPHAVKGSIVGVFVINPEEIYLEVGQGSSYVINGKGEKLKYKAKSYDWDDEALLDAFAFMAPTNPGYKMGEKVIFSSCMTHGWNLRNVGYILDIESLETESLININKLNTKWYGPSAPMIMHYFCTDENSIYLSLPYDHTIYKFENKEIVDRINAKSELLGKIQPVANKKTEMSFFRAYEHAAINGFYGPIMFNKYTSNFYRYVYAPVKNFTKEQDAFNNRYVEVYNLEWELISRFEVPEKYYGDNVFSGPDGLCFLDYEKSRRIDDVLTFDCYKF